MNESMSSNMSNNFGAIFDTLKKIDIKDKFERERKRLDPLNIITIGKTGVGKSTLINAVFKKDLAKTGIGRPITEHCEACTIPDSPITIYDSRGIETGNDNTAILDEIYDTINDKNSSANTNDYIHICWYCVLDDSNRLDQNEIDTIKDILQKIPVIIVITQSVGGAKTNTFVTEIKNNFDSKEIENEDFDIIPVMAMPKSEESEYGQLNIKSYGIDKLIEKSYKLLPKSQKKTFVAYANNLKLKRESALTSVYLCSAAVAATAYVPIPLSDTIIMTGIQVSMMARITACFGMKLSDFDFKEIIVGLGGPFAAAFLGRTLASLLKLIPGFGTAIGGTINATTGATLTFALGKIYIEVLSSASESGKINPAKVIEALNNAVLNTNLEELKKEYEKNKDNYSKSEVEQIIEETKKDLGK